MRRSAIAPYVIGLVGDTSWTDCTITLKARKLSGDNGFQIYFHNRSNRERILWDLGGFGNRVRLMEIGITSNSIKAGIEAGQWYDIEIRGNSVKGYLDGKFIQEVSHDRANAKSLCASAAHDGKSGDIILKVVNAASGAVRTRIDLQRVWNAFREQQSHNAYLREPAG